MVSVFGDKRLDQRLSVLTEELSVMPSGTLPQTLTNMASLKAGYRFMNNERVTHEGIIETEVSETVTRLQDVDCQVILAVQDTTSFSFKGRGSIEGLGVVEDNRTAGFLAHTTLAVTDEGVPMGVLAQQVWSRPQKLNRDKEAHKSKPITEKESNKWLRGLSAIPELSCPIITVCDREADIYELFQDALTHQHDFIVRVARNRRLEDVGKLYDKLGQIAPVTTSTISVGRQRNQAERQATVEMRYTTVTLRPPKNRPQSAQAFELTPLTVQLVEVREINPPDDVKHPLLWILMTSLPVTSIEDAQRIVRFYTYRWVVERFHYVLKSGGCDFEASQLRTAEALYRLVALCSRVAWRLLWLTYQSRQTPDAPCTLALTASEWQALTAYINHSPQPASSPPTLQNAVRAIAKLGGFIGRKSDGQPGVKTLWRGWQRFQDIVATWMLFHPTTDVGND